MRWIHAEGPAVWMLRLLTLAQLLLGAAWTLRAAARRHRLGSWSRALVPPALLIGLAVSVGLIGWGLPSSALCPPAPECSTGTRRRTARTGGRSGAEPMALV